MKVREFLEEYCFADNDTVFLCQLGTRKTVESLVRDIPSKVMRKELITVQGHFGGVEHNYDSYRLIYHK